MCGVVVLGSGKLLGRRAVPCIVSVRGWGAAAPSVCAHTATGASRGLVPHDCTFEELLR